MKAGTESRNKTILAGVLGTGALLSCGYFLYTQVFEGTPTPVVAPAAAPAATPARGNTSNTATTRELLNEGASSSSGRGGAAGTDSRGLGAVPGVAAQKVASTSASLDPTLDESAMLRTEGLVYTGTGRNIFSLVYTPPVVIPKVVPKVRTSLTPPPVIQKPLPPPTCPPSCPPIPLKFFGTATRGGVRQAFLLSGEDVYLASQGDIVARRYKVGTINATSVQMEDLTNHFVQVLPMAAQ